MSIIKSDKAMIKDLICFNCKRVMFNFRGYPTKNCENCEEWNKTHRMGFSEHHEYLRKRSEENYKASQEDEDGIRERWKIINERLENCGHKTDSFFI